MKRIMPLLLIASVIAFVVLPLAAQAKKLPKTATPMTAEEVTAIYSDNSAVWDNSKAYFSPDKKVKGVFGKGNKRIIYSGEWSVVDNEACMKNSPKGETKTYTDCWKWWRVGDKTLTLWSVHNDDSKPDLKNGYADESKWIKKGDLVSKDYTELGGT